MEKAQAEAIALADKFNLHYTDIDNTRKTAKVAISQDKLVQTAQAEEELTGLLKKIRQQSVWTTFLQQHLGTTKRSTTSQKK